MLRAHVIRLLSLAATVSVLPLLGGCRVGYPFRGPGYDSRLGVVHPHVGKDVLVAITQGDIAPGRSNEFSRELRSVMDSMNEHDGLIGYSVRKQLFASRVWTMSAWINQESMERFARSPAHRQAVAGGGLSPGSFVLTTQLVNVEQVPLRWSQAEKLLEASTNRAHEHAKPSQPTQE